MNNKFTILLIFVFSLGSLTAQVGVETDSPSETLDVNGTLRVRNLPVNKVGKKFNGEEQANTTFNALNTVVADDQGVLGILTGISPISKTSCYASTSRDFSEIAQNQGVARVDMEKFSFEYRPSTLSSSGNELYVINNTATTYYGKSKGDSERGTFFTLPPNEWRQLSSNINYDTEGTGELSFFTDVDGTNISNSDFNYYKINFFTQKRVFNSYPSVCFNIIRLK